MVIDEQNPLFHEKYPKMIGLDDFRIYEGGNGVKRIAVLHLHFGKEAVLEYCKDDEQFKDSRKHPDLFFQIPQLMHCERNPHFELTQAHIAELIIFSIDKRFPGGRAPRKIQWLSDRGSIYRAHLTRDTARMLNLESCHTAAYSASSNGMAEAFVGTIKRDYVYTSDCYDAKTVLKMLPAWFEDYNSEAPHSALQMMSPREFIGKNHSEIGF